MTGSCSPRSRWRRRVQLGPEGARGPHRDARRTYPIGERPVRRDHTDRTGYGSREDMTNDLIVGSVTTRAGRTHDLDDSRGDRGRRRPLEDDHDLFPAPSGPVLELADKADHRRVAVPPPSVGARADHIHAIHDPPHRRAAYERASAPSARAGMGYRRWQPALRGCQPAAEPRRPRRHERIAAAAVASGYAGTSVASTPGSAACRVSAVRSVSSCASAVAAIHRSFAGCLPAAARSCA
jgi:hypothetical protein